MKGVKAILLLVSALFVNLVSAYGEQYGTLIAGVYVDTELVFAAVLFLLFFMCLMIVTRKMNLLKNDMVRIVISMILSLFAIYGIQKAGIDLSKIVYDIGIERFLMEYFPLILLVLTIIAMLMWGIGTVFMLWGGIFFIAGLLGSVSEDIVYNWEIAMMIGVILFLIGLAINRKLYSRIKIIGPKWPRFRGDRNLSETKLVIFIDNRKFEYTHGQTINVPCGFGELKHIHLENKGENKIRWKIARYSQLDLTKRRGRISKGYSKTIKAKITDPSRAGEFILTFRGTNENRRNEQYTTIILSPRNAPTPPPQPGPKPIPQPNPRPSTTTGKPTGEASLDVIIGGKRIKNGQATLDLTQSNETIIYVKNGGTGGTLGWRASSNSELDLSKTSGKLAVGKEHPIKIKVKNRTGRDYASVVINGRGGGRLGGRATRGRVMITFKLK